MRKPNVALTPITPSTSGFNGAFIGVGRLLLIAKTVRGPLRSPRGGERAVAGARGGAPGNAGKSTWRRQHIQTSPTAGWVAIHVTAMFSGGAIRFSEAVGWFALASDESEIN
jgi:hypothetical protein